MSDTTTIRLTPGLRARVRSLAKASGRSAHSLIVEAIDRYAGHEEALQSFVKEAQAADAEIERGASVYRAEDVHAWVQRLGRGETVQRPKSWRR